MKYTGIAASPGIGIGRAVLLQETDLSYSHVVYAGAEAELARLEGAISAFVEQTQAMAREMEVQVGRQQADILLGQSMMLQDPFLLEQAKEAIAGGQCAEGALDGVCQLYIHMFSAMEDELMRQRASDVQDMRTRMLKLLLGQRELVLSSLPPDTVLVAHDLTPSMTAGLKKGGIAGIITEVGGITSHSAILARTMELPAVLSVPGIMGLLEDGASVIVDGGLGEVFLCPPQDTLDQYMQKRQDALTQKAALSQYAGQPTSTADGVTVSLCGNIGTPKGAIQVMEATGEGVGLFRTEFLFMDRDHVPTEEEQYQAYRQAVEHLEGREVIIRTLDVGGDKDIPYLGLEREDNPFLGFRAIRYCLEREDIFRPQLRALLRASAHGNLKIMFPLVTCVEEVRRGKALIEELKAQLEAEGLPYNKEVPVGIMVETPAAAQIADLLARESDFFSIGTNDLTQYIMAADRGNASVTALGTPRQPAVLRAIRDIIRAGHQAGIPVGMCGEAAADPQLIPLLLAFGLDEFSVSPSAILATRKEIAGWTMERANALAGQVMACSTLEEIQAQLDNN